MTLKQVKNYSVRCINPGSETEDPRSMLSRDGVEIGAIVNGAILEAAIQWDRWFMLFLTDDIPFEDGLHIYLLDEKFQVLDTASMFWMYSTGSFTDMELIQPNIVKFRFFGDCDWRVELLREPAFRVPLLSEPAGVWRRWGFSRHFMVHGKPQPERRRRTPAEVWRDWTARKTQHP